MPHIKSRIPLERIDEATRNARFYKLIVPELNKLGLLPRKSAKELSLSVTQIVLKLEMLGPVIFDLVGYDSDYSTKYSARQIDELVGKMDADIRNPVMPAYRMVMLSVYSCYAY